jgi:DNA-binding NarL/FixJ family response regulator
MSAALKKKPRAVEKHRPAAGARAARYRILLVDDHAIVREGMAELINKQADLMVCGKVADAASALSAVAAQRPDLALVDLGLKDSDGLELIRTLHLQHPEVRTLVVSMLDEALNAEITLRAGASGYIMKDEAIDNLLVAIRRVLNGKIYLSEDMTLRVLQQKITQRKGTSPVEHLSGRELQVFQLIGHWQRSRQIAEELHLSVKTVDYYRHRIMEKLFLRSGHELIHYATEWVQRGRR